MLKATSEPTNLPAILLVPLLPAKTAVKAHTRIAPKRRQRRDPADAVMDMVQLRHHCRAVAAERQRLAREPARELRADAGRLLMLVLMAGALAFVVIAGAIG